MIELKTSVPGPKGKEWATRREAAVARGPFHVTPIYVARAEGAVIEDVDGNKYLDFASGIGVMNTGHSNPVVTQAIEEQLKHFTHTSFNVTPYGNYVELCEKLNAAAPGDFAKKSFLVNSGAEAVENAVKIARAFTKKTDVICFEHGYHGRTYMAMALTSKVVPYKQDFGPFASEVHRAPFPYEYRGETADGCFAEFKNIASRVGVDKIAAVILEPVLGEGGFVPAPKEFLKSLSDYCRANNIAVIADEIQTGFGRTGTLFASEQLDFIPDLITTAKGLGGGLPISAVTGRAEIMDAPIVGGIGGTYCGNPLACASALAVFEVFKDGILLKHAQKLGSTLRSRLLQWKEQFAFIGDVRGLGPMQAVEFVKDAQSREPNADFTKRLVKFGFENGVVLMSAGTFGNVIRFLIPLVITEDQLNEGLDVIEKGLKTL